MKVHAGANGASSSRYSEPPGLHEIPTDALLPQLAVILDSEAMKERLEDHMFASAEDRKRFLIRCCDIARVRYKPESSCMVTYRLHIEDKATRETGEQVLCGRAYPEGRSQSQWEKARGRAVVQPRFGTALLYLPELEMVLWSFPNDRKMVTLPAALDLGRGTSESLRERLASHLAPGWHVMNTASQVVHYVGEHTCTARTSIDLFDPSTNGRQAMTLFGKTYYDEEGAETDRVMRQLWKSEARRSGRLAVAQPLWYDAGLKTLWQLGVQGATLEGCDIDGPEFPSVLAEAARAVAALHVTPLSHRRSVTKSDLLSNLNTVASLLTRCRPACRSVLGPLVSRLTVQAETIPDHPTATLHGDLHMKNLFRTGNRVTLIDLDNVSAGSPYRDLGSLIAGLHYYSLLRGGAEGTVPRLAEAFLRSYEAHVPWRVSRELVDWHTAVALITERAYRCMTRLKEGRLDLVEDLIALAGQLFRTGTRCLQGTQR